MSVILFNLAALVTFGLGCLGLFAPARALKLVGLMLNPAVPHAISEVRATYGGLFVGLGGAALWFQSETVFAALLIGWIAVALSRVFSIMVDGTGTAANWGAVAFEAAFGGILALGFAFA
ncbi:MAG TPA: DUF4345 family protein [Rhizomicrobium sp.]|nr:DUF4345 family protein [Rhizomicrobium sp.]